MSICDVRDLISTTNGESIYWINRCRCRVVMTGALLEITFSKFVTPVKIHCAYQRYQPTCVFYYLLRDVSLRQPLFSCSSPSLSCRTLKEAQYSTSYCSWLHRKMVIAFNVKTTNQLADHSTVFLDYTKAILDTRRPSWTRFSTSILEPFYKIIINTCIITCIEGRVLFVLFLLFCMRCMFDDIFFVADFVLLYTLFKSLLFAISTGCTRT